MTVEEIKKIISEIEGLESIPEEQIDWFISNSELVKMNVGDFLFRRTWKADYLYIILSGRFRVFFETEQGERNMNDLTHHSVTGVLPYSRMKEATGSAEAKEETYILRLHRDKFDEMISNHHDLTSSFVHMMTSRVREFTTQRQQNEKMMSLGKLSAGLAHELNNPSAAILRSAHELQRNLKKSPDSIRHVIALNFTDEEVDTMVKMMEDKLNQPPFEMKLVEKNACEDELIDWMEDHGIDEAFDYASNFMEAGYKVEDFESMFELLGEEKTAVMLKWINGMVYTEKLVDEIDSASKRISELVGSIKSYSHMDRSQDRQKADVHSGIKNTLTMLNHKIKKAGKELILDFDEDLPQAMIFVSELNQVWTNLIDNALDAIENVDKGALKISTSRDGEFIKILIEDNGPGIPDDIKNKIFDPFFTTKEVGKGTGMGLEIARRIVLQHNGQLKVSSKPGSTVFEVCLPLEVK